MLTTKTVTLEFLLNTYTTNRPCVDKCKASIRNWLRKLLNLTVNSVEFFNHVHEEAVSITFSISGYNRRLYPEKGP